MLLALACATKLPPEILGRSYCRVICRKMIVSRGNTALWLPEEAHLGFGLLIVMFALFEEPQGPRILRILAIQPTKFAGMSRPRAPRGHSPHAIELPAKCPLLGQASQWSHPRWFPVEQSKERLNCRKCPRYQASTPRRHPWKIAVKDESYSLTLSNTSLRSVVHPPHVGKWWQFQTRPNTVTGFHQALLYVKSRHPPAYDWQDLYHGHLLSKTHHLRKDTMTANSRLPVAKDAKVSCTLASLQSCTLRRYRISNILGVFCESEQIDFRFHHASEWRNQTSKGYLFLKNLSAGSGANSLYFWNLTQIPIWFVHIRWQNSNIS